MQVRRGQQHNKTSMGDFLNPVNGHRGALVKKGIQPRDHMKENRKQLREFQDKNRDNMERDTSREPERLYKLSQFQNVQSRVFEESAKEPYRQSDGEFLRRGELEQRRDEQAIKAKKMREEMERRLHEESCAKNTEPASPRKPSVPSEPAQLAGKSNTNFISRNKQEAVSVMNFAARNTNMKKHAPEDEGGRHESFGHVPSYLANRKQQWAEADEERRRNAPDPDCPRGMIKMPEAERLDTLNTLQNSLREAMNQLSAMPFVIETPSLRKKHEMLEAKIKEIENAIKLFSRPKVFIAK